MIFPARNNPTAESSVLSRLVCKGVAGFHIVENIFDFCSRQKRDPSTPSGLPGYVVCPSADAKTRLHALPQDANARPLLHNPAEFLPLLVAGVDWGRLARSNGAREHDACTRETDRWRWRRHQYRPK
jgi:hypothetical protein